MIGCDFKYNGHWLSEYYMIMCSPEDSQTFVSREIEKGSQTSLRPIPKFYSVRYTDVLQIGFRIVKDSNYFLNQEDQVFSSDDLNEIRSWLESPKKHCELFILDETNDRETYYYGLFTSSSPYMVGDECYGITFNFTCNAPYGFSSPVMERAKIVSGCTRYDLHIANVSAERNEYLNPVIKIKAKDKFTEGDSITITNSSDSENCSVTYTFGGKITDKSIISIDCDKKIITDDEGNSIPLSQLGVSYISDYHNVVSSLFTNLYWPSLKWGDNLIRIDVAENSSIDVVEITTRYVVKGGGF